MESKLCWMVFVGDEDPIYPIQPLTLFNVMRGQSDFVKPLSVFFE